MTTQADILAEYASEIQNLTEAVRLATPDPKDQIRLLCDLASFGLDSKQPAGADLVGIAGFRNAGPSNRWANTQRSTKASYVDASGAVRFAEPKTVRPVFTNGVVTGYLDEPSRTNFQVSSTNISIGAAYSIGSNVIDNGAVLAPDGTLTARRLTSGPSGPLNVYIGRTVNLTASPNTTYTVSAWVRKNAGTLTQGTGLTVDEFTSASALITRNGSASYMTADTTWRRFTRTFTTSGTTAAIQVYYADNWSVGASFDVWGFQIEQGNTATSLIATPANAGATRAADAITIATPAALAPAAQAQLKAEQATQALCRRAALVSLASAVALYAPASSNEAANTLRQVKALYDAEILNAGDLGDMGTYSELRSLRSAVISDLQERGLKLPEIVQVSRVVSLPALVLGYDLYQDADRGDELVRRVNCPHPAFFPTSFEALSS